MIAVLSLLVLTASLHQIPISLAQTSEAACLPYYQWTTNSQGKTPCEVASALIAPCNGGSFEVVPLSEGQHYTGPTMVSNANSCMCNTVTYSMMTACGLCQGRSVLRWSEWATNCPNVTLERYPESLPPGLRVPAWAYYDVKTNDIFDQFRARDNANATESTAIPSSTVSPSSSANTTSTPAITSSQASSTTAGEAAASESAESASSEESVVDIGHANVVGGAVVGSLLGTALIVGGGAFWLRQQRRKLVPSSAPAPT